MSTYRARDVTKWRIEQQPLGDYDVYMGRKRVKRNIDYVGAIRHIRSVVGDMAAPIKVVVVEPDGYETDITRRLIKTR